MARREPCVYLLASGKNGRIYTGVTSDLLRRISEHREGSMPGWTSRKKAVHLVHYERYDTMEQAIAREKALKNYSRAWKKKLIERDNADWMDLFETLW